MWHKRLLPVFWLISLLVRTNSADCRAKEWIYWRSYWSWHVMLHLFMGTTTNLVEEYRTRRRPNLRSERADKVKRERVLMGVDMDIEEVVPPCEGQA